MTVTLSFLPNEADATYADQAEPDSVDFEILLAGHGLTGVVSGCAVTESGTPAQTVDVAVGTVRVAGETVSVSAQAGVSVSAADGTNPRIDLISINSSGTAVVTAGTPAAQPVAPAIPATSVPLAFLYVPANDNTHGNAQINDKRVIVPEAAVFNVKDYGATGDGTTDDRTAIYDTIIAANTVGGGMVYFPAGTYRCATGITTIGVDDVTLKGEGTSSILKGDAAVTILQLDGSRFVVRDLAFLDGAIGLQVDTAIDSKFYNLRFDDQTTNAVLLDGDGAMEQIWTDIVMRVIGAEAFKYTRTTTTDTGGLYMSRVQALDDGSTGTMGFLFTSSAGTVTPIFVYMYNCIANNYASTGVKFDNVSRVNIDSCFFTSNVSAGSGTAALHIDDGFLFNIDSTFLIHERTAAADSFCLLINGGAHEVIIDNCFFDGETQTTAIGVTAAGSNIILGDYYSWVGTFTDDASALVTGTGDIFAQPRAFWTRHDGGADSTIGIENATATYAGKYLFNNFGSLAVKNGAFTTTIWELTDSGDMNVVGALNHDGSTVGFYGTTPAVQPDGVSAAKALTDIGLLTNHVGVFNVMDYGAVGDGSTNDTTAIQAAIDAAEVSGGVVVFPTADYATNALTLNGNEKVILAGMGSTIRAFSGSITMLTINRTYGGTAIACEVKDFLFHNNSKTVVTAIEVQDTHRAYLHNLDFNNTFATAIYLHNNDTDAHTEGTVIENVFITGSDTGIKFVKETLASDSFNQTHLINVGITDCDTGIDIGSGTNLARCTFVNVTVWAYRDNSTCLTWDGYTDMVFWDLHFEAISSTGTTGLELGSNLTYFSDNNNHHINLTFIGTFADEVLNASSKPLRYTDGPNVVYTGSITPWGIKDEGEGSPALIWDSGLNQFKRGDGSAWPAKIFPLEATEIASSPTLDWSHGVVNIESTAAGRSVTLPDNATYDGKQYLIRRDGSNSVTINRAGSDTFDDAATSKVLASDGAAIGIFSIGDGEWKIVGTQGTVT